MRALLFRSARAAFSRNSSNLRRSGAVAIAATLATNVPLPVTASPSFASCHSTISRAAVMSATAVAVATGTTVAYASAGPEAYNPSKEEIAGCIAAIESILDENDDIGPTLVRLAWHASGTYDKETGSGGSDGATMRFKPEAEHGANAGLGIARDALEPVKKLFPNVSYADIWTLAGAVAIEYMGGPKVDWNPGRRDALTEAACPPDGRLPDADKGQVGKTIRHIRDIFYRQGFNDREICALIGAHALGRCHANASGYEGPWTRAPTTFSNEYFKELLNNEWTLKTWEGPDQFEDPTGALMMLPADMALLWDKEFRKFVKLYAENEEAFFNDFAKAFQKLEENGVKALGGGASTTEPWYKFW